MRSRAASAAPSSVRSIGEPPSPPTRSGQPYRIQPASNRIDFTRCICAICSSSVPGARVRRRELVARARRATRGARRGSRRSASARAVDRRAVRRGNATCAWRESAFRSIVMPLSNGDQRRSHVPPWREHARAAARGPVGDRQHRRSRVAGSDPAPGPRARGRARLRPGEGRRRRGGAVRRGADRRPRDDRSGRDPRARRRLRAVHAARARPRRRRHAARSGDEHRHDARRVLRRWRRLDDDTRARVLDACARGGSSIYATGSSPGFITDALPVRAAVDAAPRRVDRDRRVREPLAARLAAPALRADGVRQAACVVQPAARGSTSSASSGRRSACSPRPRVDRSTSGPAPARSRPRAHATSILAGELAAGSVAAQRTTIVGTSAGDEVVRFTANWYCTDDVEPAWDLRPTGWRVRVRGDAPFDVDLTFPIPLDDLGSFTPAYTANRPVNAIPYVCAAPPGILATADLPPIVPAGPSGSGWSLM